MNAPEMAGPSVSGALRLESTCTSETTVPSTPIVGATPPAFSKTEEPSLWRAAIASISASRISRRRSGSVPSTMSCMPLRMNGSSMASISSSSASRPSLRARSAKATSVLTRAPRSGCSVRIAFMYSLGIAMKRFIPTPPKIAPPVPPSTMIRALMLRSIGGATPSMMPAMMMAAAAIPIPIAVAAFMSVSPVRRPLMRGLERDVGAGTSPAPSRSPTGRGRPGRA